MDFSVTPLLFAWLSARSQGQNELGAKFIQSKESRRKGRFAI
jgi:hypothetical protein